MRRRRALLAKAHERASHIRRDAIHTGALAATFTTLSRIAPPGPRTGLVKVAALGAMPEAEKLQCVTRQPNPCANPWANPWAHGRIKDEAG
jgi:hypothetical protein